MGKDRSEMGEGMHRTSAARGAALVTVLLFTALLLILITSMLTITGNEVVISGLQRDSVRAMELAQAALQEAVRRMEAGRPYARGFTSSLSPSASVTVVRLQVGAGAAYQEIRGTGTVGRAQRRLSMLVLQQQYGFPPNITFASSINEQGSADITAGDVYARTYIQYKNLPSDPNTLTYGGWRISKANPGARGPCYTHTQCAGPPVNQPTWYPGHRRTVQLLSASGQDLWNFQVAAQATSCAIPSPYNTMTFSGTLQTEQSVANWPRYGFDRDDPDGGGPLPSQLDPTLFPCGLPYKWEPEPVLDESGSPAGTKYFKTLIFEEWFANYWRFDESKIAFIKRDGAACADPICLASGVEPNLAAYPEFGAVPPFPEVDTVTTNFDCKKSGGGTISSLPIACDDPSGVTSDLGCNYPQMSCSPPQDRAVAILLDGGNWLINANLKGHGTIIVNGNLVVNGDFEFWGTLVVNGTLELGAGNATVHGGLVAQNTLKISGNITVEGGPTISGSVPVGPSRIIGKAWWER